MTSYRIEPAAAPAAIATARQLFREYQAELGVDLCFQGFEREVRELPGDYVPPGGALLLAEAEGAAGAVAGCVALHRWDDGRAEMKRLYVRPAFRGSGLGRQLVARVIATARAAGYRALRLDTLPSMATALALYRRMGFQEIPPYRDNPVAGVHYLELPLDA